MPALNRIAYLLACAAALVAGGCTTISKTPPRADWNGVRTNLSKQELGERLAQFQDTYEATIREAADRILAQQADRRTRRLLLLWQTRLVALMRDTLDQDDAIHGLLDAWALCLRAQHYFEEGDGRALFGDKQQVAREAAERSLASIERIAGFLLPAQGLDQARRAVDDLARQFPLRGEFSGATVRTAVQQPATDQGVITTLLRAPIAPFRAFEGIDRGAAAIQGFTAVAARMTNTVHDLPESLRLQAQLLAMELEELEVVQEVLANLAEFSRSAARMSAAAETLPEDLRREFTCALEDLDERQTRFQQTLHEAQELTTRVNETLARVETTAGSVTQTATHTAAAGDAWTRTFEALGAMVASFREPADGAMPARPVRTAATRPAEGAGRGFDVNDYTRAAQAIDQAALELQQLTGEVRALAGAPELQTSLRAAQQRAAEIVELSHARGRALVDHLAWRAAQLVLLTVALVGGVQWLLRRRAARNLPTPSGSA